MNTTTDPYPLSRRAQKALDSLPEDAFDLTRTVYAVEAGDYEDHMVVGVELSREAAEKMLERWNRSAHGRSLGRGGIVEYRTGIIYGDKEWE